VKRVRSEVRTEVRRSERPEAFSMMALEGRNVRWVRGEDLDYTYRSMAVMTGATHTPAVAAERRSPPSL